MPEITYSIIGTAGRKDDSKKLSKAHFDSMVTIAEGLLEQINESNYPITHLVSGGAAWADHVAVKLFLNKKVPNLRLFLPDLWDNGRYHDTGEHDPFKNPGGTSNYYHGLFQRKTGINSLSDIQIAIHEGAEIIDKNLKGNALGFHPRNALVAKSDFILACTFGSGQELKDGGTADTIRKYLDRVRKEGIFDKSFHYDLNSWQIFEGCIVPPKQKQNELEEILKRPSQHHFSPLPYPTIP